MDACRKQLQRRATVSIIKAGAVAEDYESFTTLLYMLVETSQWSKALELLKPVLLTASDKDCFTGTFDSSSPPPHLKKAFSTATNLLQTLNRDFRTWKNMALKSSPMAFFTMKKYEDYKADDDIYMTLFVMYGFLRLNPPSTDEDLLEIIFHFE